MSTNTILKREGLVGRTADGDRVYVRVEFRHHTFETEHETIDHAPIDAVTELSISGHRKRYRTNVEDGGGQNRDDLRAVTRPAPGWTLEELSELADLWQRWHLNAMKAACAHQMAAEVPEGTPWDQRTGYVLANTPACPETGYRYGHAWLVEQIPPAVVNQLYRLADKLDGGS
jgi:hypothetical protein